MKGFAFLWSFKNFFDFGLQDQRFSKLLKLVLIYFSILIFLIGILVFSMNHKHLLSLLLSLEFITLSLYFFLVIFFSFYLYESFFLIVFLTFSVCEAALGLSILVSIIRTHGNDYFLTFRILW